jgi:hypothetical protein
MSELAAGCFVLVEPTAPGLRDSYPAANWLTGPQVVCLLETAPDCNSLDVVDVVTSSETENSVYSFNIVRRVRTPETVRRFQPVNPFAH